MMADGGGPSSSSGGGAEPWRRLLLALVVAGSAGIAAELGLLGRYEDWAQRIPLLALVACA